MLTAAIHNGHVYEVEQLTKVYGPSGLRANDCISFDIRHGEIFGIVGQNGAGKTTLVRQMAGLLKPTSGRISLLGTDVVTNPAAVPYAVAYAGQRPAALRAHTFFEALYCTGIFRGLSRLGAAKQARDLVEQFGLEHTGRRALAFCSGGERRLAGVLSAFMGDLPVFILDEPTNDLDPMNRRRLWDLLLERNRSRGTTIVLVTHNLLEAETVVDRIMIVNEGRVQALGTLGELKRLVSNQVRLRVRVRECGKKEAEAFFGAVPESHSVRDGVWEISATVDSAQDVLQSVIRSLGINIIDDFRLATPTLEDVYIQVTGRRWADHAVTPDDE